MSRNMIKTFSLCFSLKRKGEKHESTTPKMEQSGFAKTRGT